MGTNSKTIAERFADGFNPTYFGELSIGLDGQGLFKSSATFAALNWPGAFKRYDQEILSSRQFSCVEPRLDDGFFGELSFGKIRVSLVFGLPQSFREALTYKAFWPFAKCTCTSLAPEWAGTTCETTQLIKSEEDSIVSWPVTGA